jgi:hypothetical protein
VRRPFARRHEEDQMLTPSLPMLQHAPQPQALVIQVPPRRWSWAFALGSFTVGVVLTLTSLAVFAPRPGAVRSDPGSSQLMLALNDAFLSQVAAKGLALADLPFVVTQVQAHATTHDQISVSAVADLVLVTSPLQATAQIMVSNGHLVVHTIAATVGGLALPAPLTGLMDAQINQQLAHATQGLFAHGAQYRLTGVTSTDGALDLLLTPNV